MKIPAIINHASRHNRIWGYSSAGRALEWHSRGQRFDPAYLHQQNRTSCRMPCFCFVGGDKRREKCCAVRRQAFCHRQMTSRTSVRRTFAAGKRKCEDSRSSKAAEYPAYPTTPIFTHYANRPQGCISSPPAVYFSSTYSITSSTLQSSNLQSKATVFVEMLLPLLIE